MRDHCGDPAEAGDEAPLILRDRNDNPVFRIFRGYLTILMIVAF